MAVPGWLQSRRRLWCYLVALLFGAAVVDGLGKLALLEKETPHVPCFVAAVDSVNSRSAKDSGRTRSEWGLTALVEAKVRDA